MFKIVRRELFSETCFLWEIEAPDVARAAEPGHFVMVRLYEGAERIPQARNTHAGRQARPVFSDANEPRP
jgi:NAD(P)H-flavin reductase